MVVDVETKTKNYKFLRPITIYSSVKCKNKFSRTSFEGRMPSLSTQRPLVTKSNWNRLHRCQSRGARVSLVDTEPVWLAI